MRAKNFFQIPLLSLFLIANFSVLGSLTAFAAPGQGGYNNTAPGTPAGSEPVDKNENAQHEEIYEHEMMLNGEVFYVSDQELEEILKVLDLD